MRTRLHSAGALVLFFLIAALTGCADAEAPPPDRIEASISEQKLDNPLTQTADDVVEGTSVSDLMAATLGWRENDLTAELGPGTPTEITVSDETVVTARAYEGTLFGCRAESTFSFDGDRRIDLITHALPATFETLHEDLSELFGGDGEQTPSSGDEPETVRWQVEEACYTLTNMQSDNVLLQITLK